MWFFEELSSLYRIGYLNTWSLVGGLFGKVMLSFMRLRLAGGSTVLGVGFEGLWSCPTSHPFSFLGVDKNVISQLPVPVATMCLPHDGLILFR